ncbi:MAG TPA: hypothetical protein VGB24_00595 [Longimicrobium sp.]|jgi:hypothetical protein|uniref:hypothetical protein n=1 Tax=Longimicrobium sp. TaxID=2029185 RepID=UPI002ED93789
MRYRTLGMAAGLVAALASQFVTPRKCEAPDTPSGASRAFTGVGLPEAAARSLRTGVDRA